MIKDDFELELSNAAKKALELDVLIKELKLEGAFKHLYSNFSGALLPPKINEGYKNKHDVVAQFFIDTYMEFYNIALSDKSVTKLADKSMTKEDLVRICFLEMSKKIQPLDALTVFYIIQRMDMNGKYTSLWEQELKQQLPSVSKSKSSDALWKTYKEKFNRFINEGVEQSEAIKQIGNLIEEENTKRKANKEKLIGTKGGNLRPTLKTLLDQLLHRK
jgi:hypothetical protein